MKKKPDRTSQKDREEVDVPELTDDARMRPAHEVLPALIGEHAAAELVTEWQAEKGTA